jgi:hypothetical protein
MCANRYGRQAGVWVVAGLLMAGLVACGSARPARPSQAASPSSRAHRAATSECPPSVPSVVQLRGSGRLGAAPDGVPLCSYSDGQPTKLRTAAGVTLLASTARTVATLLADESPAGPSTTRCLSEPPSLLLRFHYAHAPTVAVALINAKPCSANLVYLDGRAYAISENLAETLFYNGSAGDLGVSGPRLDLEGIGIDPARRVAREDHVALLVDGAELDPSVPVGTVLLQSPAPNAGEVGGQLEVLIATRDDPVCRPAQLALDYYGGGLGGGSDFGVIRIRDTSGVACKLAGPVLLHGLGADGTTDTASVADTVVPNLDLTPRAARVPDGRGPRVGTITGLLLFSADYRDDPTAADDLCPPAHAVTPARWQLTTSSGVLFATNRDTGSSFRGAYRSLITCRGELNRAAVVRAG